MYSETYWTSLLVHINNKIKIHYHTIQMIFKIVIVWVPYPTEFLPKTWIYGKNIGSI